LNTKEAKKRLEANRELKLYLGGLPDELTEKDLADYFSTFGELSNSYIIYDFDTKKSRGFGFVEFKRKEDVKKVLDLDHKIGNKFIHVSKMKLKNDIKKERQTDKGKRTQVNSTDGSHPGSMGNGYPQHGYPPHYNGGYGNPGMPHPHEGNYFYGN
jgi:RNA recognition motif-containing protein